MPASGADPEKKRFTKVSNKAQNAPESCEASKVSARGATSCENLSQAPEPSRPASSRSTVLHAISNDSPLTDPGSAVGHVRSQPVRPHTTPQAAVTWSLHQIRPVDRGRWPGSTPPAHPLPPTNRLLYVLTLCMVVLLIVLVFSIGVIIVTLPTPYQEPKMEVNISLIRNKSRANARMYDLPDV